ncbi:limbic system-associated membrane protein-like [Dendronephthya gigantea]|uniref:limbic system-associated membrane protein-like n=1 Tax=Dendronephthya gigantea TaxID=151771 RepID=UPI00106B170C|nr:limbic system-associated membrane protein-like [Dendronephthya gigantea]
MFRFAHGVFILFGLSGLLLPCSGTVYPPANGARFTLLKGSTARISWRFDGVGTINARSWYFQSIDASREETIALLPRNNVSDIPHSSLPRVNVEAPATLILQNVTEKYNGTYRFELSAAGGGDSSIVVYIAVTASVSVGCFHYNTVNTSDEFSCVCRGEGGNPPAKITWYKGNKIMATGIVEAKLKLSNVDKDDSGNYTCVAESHEKAKNETEIELIVNYPPKGTRLKFDFDNETSVTIICEADALPPPKYEIYFNGTTRLRGKKTYKIDKVTSNFVGKYTCVAWNLLGRSFSSSRFLPVQSKIINLKLINRIKQFPDHFRREKRREARNVKTN